MAAARVLAGGRLRSAAAVVGPRLTAFAPHAGRRCPLALDAPTAPGFLAPHVPALLRRAPEYKAGSANLSKAGVGGRRRTEEQADGDVAAGGRTEKGVPFSTKKVVKLAPFSTGGAQSEGEELGKAGASGVAGLGKKAEEEAGVGKTKVADGKVDAAVGGLAGSDAGHTGPGFGEEIVKGGKEDAPTNFCRFDDGLRSQIANVETNTRLLLLDLFEEYGRDRDAKARKESNRQLLFTIVIALVIEIGVNVLNKGKNITDEKKCSEAGGSGGKVKADSSNGMTEKGGKGGGGDKVEKGGKGRGGDKVKAHSGNGMTEKGGKGGGGDKVKAESGNGRTEKGGKGGGGDKTKAVSRNTKTNSINGEKKGKGFCSEEAPKSVKGPETVKGQVPAAVEGKDAL